MVNKEKIYYGLGQFGVSLLSSFIGSSVIFFYDEYTSIQDIEWVSYAFIAYTIWNLLNDPLFGSISDKTKHKLGRRIPFIRYGSYPLIIFFIFMWIPIDLKDDLSFFIYILIFLILFDTFYTIVGVSYFSLLPQLTLDENERASYSKIAVIFSVLGISSSYMIPLLTDNRMEYIISMIIIALISLFSILSLTYNVKEKIQPLENEYENDSVLTSLKYCLKNKAFIPYVIVMFGLTFYRYVIMNGIIYFFKILINGNQGAFVNSLLILVPFIIMGILFILRLNKKIGLFKVFLLGISLMILGMLFFIFIPISEFPPNNIMIFVILSIFSIALLGFIIYMMFENTLLGRIVDYDELNTGKRREGMYFGTKNLITKPANSLGILYFTEMLTFYSIEIETIGLLSFQNLIFTLFGFPLIIMVLNLIVFLKFPLHGKKLDKIKLNAYELHSKSK